MIMVGHYPSHRTRAIVLEVIGVDALADVVMQYSIFDRRGPICSSLDFACGYNGLWEECMSITSAIEGANGAALGEQMGLLAFMFDRLAPAVRQSVSESILMGWCSDWAIQSGLLSSELVDFLLSKMNLVELIGLRAKFICAGDLRHRVILRIIGEVIEAYPHA